MSQRGTLPQSPEKQIPLLLVIHYLGSVMMGLSFAMIYMPVPEGVETFTGLGGKVLLGLAAVVLVLVAWQLLERFWARERARPSPLLWVVVALGVAVIIPGMVWWLGSPVAEAAPLVGIGGTLLAGLWIGVPFGVVLHALFHLVPKQTTPTGRQQG